MIRLAASRPTAYSVVCWVFALALLGCKPKAADPIGPNPPPPPPGPVQPTVSLSNPALSLRGEGTEGSLTATVTPSTATVTWRVDKPAVATVTPANATAVVRAVKAGGAVVTVTATNGALTAEATATITVVPIVRTITITPSADTVSLPATRTYPVTITADSGASTVVTWRSSNPAVATVAETGTVTAVAAGTTTITALAVEDTTKRATVALTVRAGLTFPLNWTETTGGFGAPYQRVNDLAALPNGETLGVGAGGMITTRSAGGEWTQQPTLTTESLSRISAPTADSIWVGGAKGVILRKTGSGWVRETTGTTANLRALTMAADGTGYAAFDQGNAPVLILARTGGVWAPIDVPADPTFARVSELSVAGGVLYTYTSDVFNFPRKAFLFKRSGGTWTRIDGPAGAPNGSSVLALSATDALVAGEDPNGGFALIWRVSGTTWQQEWRGSIGTTANFGGPFTRCLDGTIMGQTSQGLVLARTGTTWTERPEQAFPGTALGWSSEIACTSPTAWAFVGSSGVLGSASGGTARIERTYFGTATGMKLAAGPSLAFAGTPLESIALRWDGASWLPLPVPLGSFPFNGGPSFAVTGPSSARALVSDYLGSWNGATWTWQEKELPGYAMWASGPSDVWAVGRSRLPSGPGGISRFTTDWTDQGVNDTYYTIHGAGPGVVFALGGSGDKIARSTPGGIRVDAVSLPALFDIVAFSASSAIAVGAQGRVIRFDGTTWTTVPSPTTETFVAVTGRSPTEVYAFTATGNLYGYNGTDWGFIRTFTAPIRAARLAGTIVLGVGDFGTFVYGRPAQP